MDNQEEKMRELNTLTTDEIIDMVDVLAFCSRTLLNGGDMRYRKIEAKLAPGEVNLSCRVTYAESVDAPKETLAFLIERSFGDIIVKGVNRQRFTKEFVDGYSVTYDFGLLEQSIKENYLLFAETLFFWRPDALKLIVNKNLNNQWYTVEEYSRKDSGIQELA